jgi:hypothetical protein
LAPGCQTAILQHIEKPQEKFLGMELAWLTPRGGYAIQRRPCEDCGGPVGIIGTGSIATSRVVTKEHLYGHFHGID